MSQPQSSSNGGCLSPLAFKLSCSRIVIFIVLVHQCFILCFMQVIIALVCFHFLILRISKKVYGVRRLKR